MTLIAHISDLHFRPKGQTCYGVSHSNTLAERAIHSILSLETRPDAVVMTGDLVDSGDKREYRVAQQALERLPMPVYLLPGNHDNRARMFKAFEDYPGFNNATENRICYCTEIGSLRLVALDTHIPGHPQGKVGNAQLEWLDSELAKSQRPTLVALHHPPAPIGLPHLDEIGLLDSQDLAAVIAKHSHVKRLMCGHLHRPMITEFAGSIMTMVPGTAHQTVLEFTPDRPPMFNFEPAAYFLHHHTPEADLVTHMVYVENYPGPHHYFVDHNETPEKDIGE